MKKILILLTLTSLSSCGVLGIKSNKHTPSEKHNKTQTITKTVDDLRISAGIHVDLYCLDLFKPVDVKVQDGVVYYTGSVHSLKESFAASGIAWKQNGVKKVVNNLKVEEKSISPSATWSSQKSSKR